MKRKLATITMIAAALLFPAIRSAADNDVDLPINGDFKGAPSGYCPAPGWTLTPDGGNARILPTTDRDDFMLELRAAPERSQSVISGLHALPGGVLKLEAKVQGSGSASIGYEAFDETQRTMVGSDRQTAALGGHEQKLKRYFTLPAQARFIRIRLTAEAGATATFRDVDADVSLIPAAQPAAVAAPAPGVIAAPPPVAAPAPGTIAAPAPAAAPTPAAASAPTPVGARALQDDRYYSFGSLGADEHFEISLPVGSDIDFELGEDVSSNLYWRVVSYDSNVCRVKFEHDQDGVFPFRRDKAEIELKAIGRGTTAVVFSCGGKQVTVHFTAL